MFTRSNKPNLSFLLILSDSFSRRSQQAKGSIKMEQFEDAWLCEAWTMLKYACCSIPDWEAVQASLAEASQASLP